MILYKADLRLVLQLLHCAHKSAYMDAVVSFCAHIYKWIMNAYLTNGN